MFFHLLAQKTMEVWLLKFRNRYPYVRLQAHTLRIYWFCMHLHCKSHFSSESPSFSFNDKRNCKNMEISLPKVESNIHFVLGFEYVLRTVNMDRVNKTLWANNNFPSS